MKISGCIIARNEEANIAKCINNLKHVTDEIIVVDTGSEDDTIRSAKELGASVYEQKWENDFSKARNAALERATGDWIIFLDADEFFNEESLLRVRPTIQKAHSNQNIEGMLCNLINVDLETKKDIDAGHVIRIFRNKRLFRFINKIHEEICNDSRSLRYIDKSDTLTVIHTGYSSSLRISKARRNLEMLLDNKEGHERSAYYLATTYFSLHDFNNAYQYAELALLEKSVTECDHFAYKMHFIKIIIAMTLESSNKEKIELLIREANKKYSEHPEIAKIEAVYRLQEKRYAESLDKYSYSLTCQEKYGKKLVQNNFAETVHEVYFSIAQISYLMNKEADALSYYVKALRSNKYNKEVFKSMFGLCMTMPEYEMIAFFNSIYDVEKEEDVNFIIAQIADCGIPKLVLYYANKWNNTFAHEDDVLIYAFLAQHNYQNALEIALLYLKNDPSYSPLVTSILIMGRLFPEAEKIKDEIGEDYFNLIMYYADGRNYSENDNTYASVFSKLIRHADQSVITDYLKLADAKEASLISSIAETFLTIFHYEQAISYYQLLFELASDEAGKAVAAFQLGYCFYKQKQYEESLYWFEKAIRNGYAENDMAEYLQWIANQTSDDGIKRKSKALMPLVNMSAK